MPSIPKKTTFLPVSGLVDISDILPILDHPLFQRLRHVKQLALIHLEHAGGTHTRFEHSLGVYALTKRMVEHLPFSSALKKALPVFGLLHDVGHGAFSHTLEPLLVGEHKEKTIEIIKTLSPQIKRAGVSPALVLDLAKHHHSAHVVVSDKNLGADKLDYLERDAYHLGWPSTLPKDSVIAHMVWLEKQKKLAVEEKAMEQVMTIQYRYFEQYLQVYLRKISTITGRMLQRAVWEDGRRAKFVDATDAEVFGALLDSPSAAAKKLAHGLVERKLHKTVLTLKPAGYERVERTAHKALRTIAVPEKTIYRLLQKFDDQKILARKEDEICAALKLPRASVLIATPGQLQKVNPQPVLIYNISSGKAASLFDIRPGHSRSLTERVHAAMALRVCVPPGMRSKLLKHTELIKKILTDV